jgi:hypothetical protein
LCCFSVDEVTSPRPLGARIFHTSADVKQHLEALEC